MAEQPPYFAVGTTMFLVFIDSLLAHSANRDLSSLPLAARLGPLRHAERSRSVEEAEAVTGKASFSAVALGTVSACPSLDAAASSSLLPLPLPLHRCFL